jgi:hypothetical protein
MAKKYAPILLLASGVKHVEQCDFLVNDALLAV